MSETDPIDDAIGRMCPHGLFRHGDREFTIACLLRTQDWRPLKALWWCGKEVCIIGVDPSGNFFLRHCDGSVRFWDHHLQAEEKVASSVKEFSTRICAASYPAVVSILQSWRLAGGVAEHCSFGKRMKAIATALLNLAAFIELSGDDVIDPDSAVKALEQLSADLGEAEAGEKEYLKALMRQQIGSMPDNRSQAQQRLAEFYLDLMEQLDDE